VRIEESSPAIDPWPWARVLRAKLGRLPDVARRDDVPLRGVDAQPCDRGQCRIIINDLERQISRLRRGIDLVDLSFVQPPPPSTAPDTCPDDVTRDSLAMREPGRKSYAPPAVGEIPPPAPKAETPSTPASVENYPQVTNLGTLIDVLA
jgi:hypothetical protein